VGQGWGIAPRPRKRSQRSPYDLPGRLQVSLLAVAVVLFAGWQAPPAQADAEPATTVAADVATGVAEGAAPSLATPAATTDTDEIAADGEAPSEAEPHPAPGQEPAEPTSPGVPPASAGATPAPDCEPRHPRPTRDAEPGHPRPTPDAESRQPRPTPDAEPPRARPAPEATKEHPAGAVDVTTADSPAVAQPTAQSGSELKPTGPPNLEPAGRPSQVDAPGDERAPARPPRARTRTAQAPSLPPSHAPAAPRRLAHESAPGAAYPAAPPRRVRKHAARQDRSVTRARGSQSRPTPEAPHRRGAPGAASAAAAAGSGTASPNNAVLSGEADLAPAGLVRPLRLSRRVLRPTSVAEPRERPG
jgi:ribonuclease E